MKNPVIIIGAGLSGLRAASLLLSHGIECRVLEARGRIGGRVLSMEASGRQDLGRFDLGPTWFWPSHEPVISALVSELGLRTFEQHTDGAILFEQSHHGTVQRHILPEGASERSLRIDGGVQSLIDSIVDSLPSETVELNTRVKTIHTDESGILTLETEQTSGKRKTIHAETVILALPPRIIAKRMAFSPPLPAELMASLGDKPTWMAGQAKVVAVYDRPFWRDENLSGQAMSWAGPLQEIHDASPDTGCGALFGFFGMPAKERQELGEERVLKLVLGQLERMFGPVAEKPLALLYKDWAGDSETAVDEDKQPLTSFPNYGLPKLTGLWESKILFAGTEASPGSGGHLEGALQSAERAVSEVVNRYGNRL